MAWSEWLFLAGVALLTVTATVTDVRWRRLPNWLTVPAFVAGLIFHGVTGGLSGLGTSLAGFAIGFAVLLLLWLIGGGGGGDVKLMGALGAWLGPVPILVVIALSTMFALLATVAMASWSFLNRGYGYVRRRYISSNALSSGGSRSGQSDEQVRQIRQKRRFLPYALPVTLGTWVFLAWKVLAGPAI